MSYFSSWAVMKRNYDQLLLKDLSVKFNPIIKNDEKILIYEIQGQYYINGQCISMDGIVGDYNITKTLIGDRDFETYILNENIKYIVTHEAMNYRKIFNDTLIEDLYVHDLESVVGSKLFKDKIIFTKILTNKFFIEPELTISLQHSNYNYKPKFQVYGPSEQWHGNTLFWYSVYKIDRREFK